MSLPFTEHANEKSYQRLSSTEEQQQLLTSVELNDFDVAARSAKLRRKTSQLRIISLLNVVLFGASSCMFGVSLKSNKLDVKTATIMANGYSPILDSMDLKINTVNLNGTLYPPAHPTFSRMEPGDFLAEEMWESFEPTPVFPITREQLIRIGKDPETAVKFPDEIFHLGDDAYVAALDVTHKLHCLNVLRKMAFADFPHGPESTFYGQPHPGKENTDNKLWWYHLRHCTDMLAQDIMCHADTDLLTYNFRDTQIHPFPDFAIQRQCRNIDQLLAWRDSRAVDLHTYVAEVRYENSKGTKLLPYEREFYEINGFTGSILFPDGKGFDEYWAEHWI